MAKPKNSKTKREPWRPFTEEEDARARELVARGFAPAEVANLLPRLKVSVTRWAKEEKVTFIHDRKLRTLLKRNGRLLLMDIGGSVGDVWTDAGLTGKRFHGEIITSFLLYGWITEADRFNQYERTDAWPK